MPIYNRTFAGFNGMLRKLQVMALRSIVPYACIFFLSPNKLSVGKLFVLKLDHNTRGNQICSYSHLGAACVFLIIYICIVKNEFKKKKSNTHNEIKICVKSAHVLITFCVS